MMARRFLAALALAHGAAALFEGFVDVLVRVDVQVTASDIFSGVLNAAGRDDDGYDACVAANDVLNVCYDDGYLAPTAQIGAANNCVCCLDTTPISKVYSACASYALEQGPGASRAYSTASQIYAICQRQGLCSGDIVTVTATVTSTRLPTEYLTQSAEARISLPPACASMANIYNSCSMEMDFMTARARDVASCFCPIDSGKWNTAFEGYASSCLTYARTAFPADHSIIKRLATFCDDYPPATNTNPLVFSTIRTGTGGGFELPTSTSSKSQSTGASGTASAAGSSSTASTSTSTGLAAPGAAVPSFVTWVVNLATVALSFFFML